ncbi:hypothetical protein A6585_23345 [Escherichia coli]|nr:hypothetical protein A6585_23345 [Escherichia coli]
MLPSETMIWQPEFTDKTLSRKPGAVQSCFPTKITVTLIFPTLMSIEVKIYLFWGDFSFLNVFQSIDHHFIYRIMTKSGYMFFNNSDTFPVDCYAICCQVFYWTTGKLGIKWSS